MPDMRFAPPNPIRIADRAAGLNAVSVRSYNERLVLSMLLQHGSTTRFDIGEKTGLSAQTISVIVRSLEQEGLVTRGEAQRGRMGPPTIPMGLNPEGAYSIGISIGFRTTDIVLIDFVGGVIDSATLRHAAPGADHVHPELHATVGALLAKISKAKRRRIAGIGLALPEGFGDTQELTAFKDRAEADFGLDVFVQNDVTAAANGESLFGIARDLDNYLFFYIGAMVHARLVLNHQIHRSGSNTAYDVGLLHFERALGSNGVSTEDLWRRSEGSPQYASAVETWKADCVSLLVAKVREARQFVEVGTVVLSSYAPRHLCQQICDELAGNEAGLKALVGSIHHSPKAVGAASLPYASRFTVAA
ncbi:MAG: N-acetylglucosamine repressor [Pseudomonadota bacterium]|jgi:DNA-binding transcriptional ArsR family regulator